jgi:glycosyltransferase involved in cell wall biosynthesis
LLGLLFKSDVKIAVVFGTDVESCRQAVLHIRNGAPGVPIRLFSHEEPLPETRRLCQTVHVSLDSLAAIRWAVRQSKLGSVAITVTAWTGVRGKWPLKLVPFLIPPFRTLVLNEHGDFFPGTAALILRHVRRRVRDRLHSGLHHVRDLLCAYAVWLVSLVLRVIRLCLPRRRSAGFRYMDLGESIMLDTITSRDRSVFRCTALDLTAMQSGASFLLCQEPGVSDEDVGDLLPFFEDERTFAVSRQTHFRGWKALLFPTAPFRALQSGEATQVLAPLSSIILVDRRKLLALGVPHTSLTGTAWMVLFWKAAAAGWRSYCVGPCSSAAEQPDLPVQEAGFLLHRLFHSALRRLGPREPDLCRGNIAFAIPRCSTSPGSNRIKVLLVSPFLPFPLSHGGAVRIFNLCRALRHRVDFLLAAFREHGEIVCYDRLREVFQDVYVVDRDDWPSQSSLPKQVHEYDSRSMRALIMNLAREWKPDLLQIEYTHLAGLRDAAPEIPALLVEHDLTFQLYRQLVEKDTAWNARQEYHRWREFERRWLNQFEGVWTVSDKDRLIAIHEGRRRPDRTFCVRNGVDIERFVPRQDDAECPEILYVGSFRHLPNVLGFENLRDRVLPRIWSRYPRTHCRVVAGPQPQQFWAPFSGASPEFDPRVTIHAFVEDLRPLYARAAVVVVPLDVSAGTNIKVIEAMACGKAIVTTEVGCAGLGLVDGRDAFIVRDWADFAERAIELLSDSSRRVHLGASARCTAESCFAWSRVATQAYSAYDVLLDAQHQDRALSPAHTRSASSGLS